MSGFPFDSSPIVQLFQDFGISCQYRQILVPPGTVGGSLSRSQPIGTPGPEWSATEYASQDSTVNAGTGMQGGFAAVMTVQVIFRAPGGFSRVLRGLFGLDLQETQDGCYLLPYDLSSYSPGAMGVVPFGSLTLTNTPFAPSRGDLLDHPAQGQYVVGQDQRAIGLSDRPAAYYVSLEHRALNSVTAGY